MFIIDTAAKAKKSARALEKSLAKQGIELAHGHALNVVAALAGFADWNAMHSQFQASAPSEPFRPTIFDVDFNRVERVRVFNSEYEILDTEAFDTYKPWLSKWDSLDNPYRGQNPEILMLDTLNDEVYGSETMTVKALLDFKWDASKECFVNSGGGHLTPLSTGPYVFKVAESAEKVETAPRATTPAFSIFDVDFEQVTGFSKAGTGFWVDSRQYPLALAWLKDWSNPANPYDVDSPVLGLSYLNDDGFMAHDELSAEELLALTWDLEKGVFVDPNGLDYKFAVQVPVGPGSPGLRKS